MVLRECTSTIGRDYVNKEKPIFLLLAFRAAITLVIAYGIWTHSDLPSGESAAFIAGILALQANDIWRNQSRLYHRHKLLYYGSMAASIVGTGWCLTQFDYLAINVYFVFPVVEMFMTGSAIQIGLLIFHVFVFLWTMYALKASPQNALLSYAATLFLVFLFRAHSMEKRRGRQLNAELTEAQAKLREAAVDKERTRIAQELHDSIGHSLVALRMHLEFAENVADANPEKSREVIAKALAISHHSIADLRKAVAVLKETGAQDGMELRESLNEMMQSVQTGGLAFEFEFEPAVEYARADIKTCIYNTVREAITNGLKHGRAQSFRIRILRQDGAVHVDVENDGEGCGHIVKSHGLRGIEERIRALKGTVSFSSASCRGFAVRAELPYIANTEMT